MPNLTRSDILVILDNEINKAAALRTCCGDTKQQSIVQALIEAKRAFEASDFAVVQWHQDAAPVEGWHGHTDDYTDGIRGLRTGI